MNHLSGDKYTDMIVKKPEPWYKNRKALLLLGFFVMLSGLVYAAYMVFSRNFNNKSSAATGTATVSILPSTATIRSSYNMQLWATSDKPVSFARVEVKFNKKYLKLTKVPTVKNKYLARIISRSTVEEANKNGVVVLVLGLTPELRNKPPKGTYKLADLTFAPLNKTSAKSVISVRTSGTQFVDDDEVIMNKKAKNSSVTSYLQ